MVIDVGNGYGVLDPVIVSEGWGGPGHHLAKICNERVSHGSFLSWVFG